MVNIQRTSNSRNDSKNIQARDIINYVFLVFYIDPTTNESWDLCVLMLKLNYPCIGDFVFFS